MPCAQCHRWLRQPQAAARHYPDTAGARPREAALALASPVTAGRSLPQRRGRLERRLAPQCEEELRITRALATDHGRVSTEHPGLWGAALALRHDDAAALG
jgi:glucokinase